MSQIVLNRVVIKFAGESGQGINSTGLMFLKALKSAGYFAYGYREYPSLIEGGLASYQIDIADHSINSSSQNANILICLSRQSVYSYMDKVTNGGLILHTLPQLVFTPDQEKLLKEKDIKVEYVNAQEITMLENGRPIMINTMMASLAWKILGLDPSMYVQELKNRFGRGTDILDENIKFASKGSSYPLVCEESLGGSLQLSNVLQQYEDSKDLSGKLSITMTGNEALALGAISAGVRAAYAYPMTPATSIFKYLADTYHDTGILIKQAEDEITAAQMAIGSMFMGTRALTSTSGGGFDLMAESVSLAGMTETPFVVVVAQRPGPATGLPTWTANGDLNTAVYGSHGEFPRAVLAVSDIDSAYIVIQMAFNIAEEYQIPVIVLTDKHIAESHFVTTDLPDALQIRRGISKESVNSLFKPEDRYKATDLGVSPRWLPGESTACYKANSDEHDESGNSTEDAETSRKMMDKRMAKLSVVRDKLDEPVLYGDKSADITFVGWGSVKNTVIDVMSLPPALLGGKTVNYLHYEIIYPLKTEKFIEVTNSDAEIVLLENNSMGQLGSMLTAKTGIKFSRKLLKYDGRPFFIEDILNYLIDISI